MVLQIVYEKREKGYKIIYFLIKQHFILYKSNTLYYIKKVDRVISTQPTYHD